MDLRNRGGSEYPLAQSVIGYGHYLIARVSLSPLTPFPSSNGVPIFYVGALYLGSRPSKVVAP